MICDSCGRDDWQLYTLDVELRDGTKRTIDMCMVLCADYWDDIEPGEWSDLDHLGIEILRLYWQCPICDSVCPYGMMSMMQDNDYDPPQETRVCSQCARKEKGRFVERSQEGAA